MTHSREPTNAAGAGPAGQEHLGVRRYSAAQLLGAILLLFVVTPLVDRSPRGELVEGVLLTLVLLSAVAAVGGRRRVLAIGVLLVVPAVVGKWADYLRPDAVPAWLVPAVTAVFIAFVLSYLLRFVLLAPRVTTEVVCAGVSGYLVMGLMWTFANTLAARLDAGAFVQFGRPLHPADPFDLFYYSFITQIGIGFGDISPASRATKMMAVLGGMTGMFYVVILIARLVALYAPFQRPPGPPKDST